MIYYSKLLCGSELLWCIHRMVRTAGVDCCMYCIAQGGVLVPMTHELTAPCTPYTIMLYYQYQQVKYVLFGLPLPLLLPLQATDADSVQCRAGLRVRTEYVVCTYAYCEAVVRSAVSQVVGEKITVSGTTGQYRSSTVYISSCLVFANHKVL